MRHCLSTVVPVIHLHFRWRERKYSSDQTASFSLRIILFTINYKLPTPFGNATYLSLLMTLFQYVQQDNLEDKRIKSCYFQIDIPVTMF